MGKPKRWKMPRWMLPYAPLIRNTGGNPIEELVNDHTTTARVNMIRAALCITVQDQVALLESLYARGMLADLTRKEARRHD